MATYKVTVERYQKCDIIVDAESPSHARDIVNNAIEYDEIPEEKFVDKNAKSTIYFPEKLNNTNIEYYEEDVKKPGVYRIKEAE